MNTDSYNFQRLVEDLGEFMVTALTHNTENS